MKKVLVSGATGFIAKNLITYLCKNHYYVYGLAREINETTKELCKMQNFKLIQLDMNNYERIENLLPEQCDVCYSIAWEGVRGEKGKDQFIQNNNVKNVISLCKGLSKVGCKRFIQIGSLAEYGNYSDNIDETFVCNPVTNYGKAKFACFIELSKLCRENKMEFVEARLGSIYGYEDKGIISNTIINLLQKKESHFFNCEKQWEFMYIQDCIELLVKIMLAPKVSIIYNLSNGDTRLLKSFLVILKEQINNDIEMKFDSTNVKLYSDMNIMCNITRLEEEFCYVPTTFISGINEILKRYISEIQKG